LDASNPLAGPLADYEGMVDLLFRAISHPSYNVCAIALEVIPKFITSTSDFATQLSERIFQVLLKKAIWPKNIIKQGDDDRVEFVNFRNNFLVDSLSACYKKNSCLYFDNCINNIVEQLSSQTEHDWFEVEATLFCLNASSFHVLNQMGLIKNEHSSDIKTEFHRLDSSIALKHDAQLVRLAGILIRSQNFLTSCPFLLTQTCQFVAKYASWFSSEDMLNSAAELAMVSFKTELAMVSTTVSDIYTSGQSLGATSSTPLSESAIALRNILCHSPSHFTTPQALTALASGWDASYLAANATMSISCKDRMIFCQGICCVLSMCSSKNIEQTLLHFSGPTLTAIESLRKYLDQAVVSGLEDDLALTLQKISDEITILSRMIRSFLKPDKLGKKQCQLALQLLEAAWPQLLHLAEVFGNFQSIASALGDILITSINMECNDIDRAGYCKELCNMANLVVSRFIAIDGTHIQPILAFIAEFIKTVGANAEVQSETLTDFNQMIANLLKTVFDFLYSRMNFTDTFYEIIGSSIFETLTKFIQVCPVLFIQVSESYSLSEKEGATGENMLIYWIRQALNSLSQNNTERTRNASFFLKAMVEIIRTRCQQETSPLLYSSTEKYLKIILSIRKDLICRVIRGICTFYDKDMIHPTSTLLFAIMMFGKEEDILFALLQDEFKLLETGRILVLKVLSQCKLGKTSCSHIIQMLTDIWKFHKMESSQEIGVADIITVFLKKYSPI